MIRVGTLSLILITAGGCALQRAQVAEVARNKMVGLSKEQVLACMGPPAQRMAEGQTEVWSYASGNGATTAVGSGSAYTTGSVVGTPSGAAGYARTNSSAIVTSSRRYCTVNVVMADGRVSRVNYAGPTGGIVSQGEQCAFAVQNCAQ